MANEHTPKTTEEFVAALTGDDQKAYLTDQARFQKGIAGLTGVDPVRLQVLADSVERRALVQLMLRKGLITIGELMRENADVMEATVDTVLKVAIRHKLSEGVNGNGRV